MSYDGKSYSVKAVGLTVDIEIIIPSFYKSRPVISIEARAFSGCSSLTILYYAGKEDEWNNITIESMDDVLTSATIYYYSETEPIEDGNYWHYDSERNVIVWQ